MCFICLALFLHKCQVYIFPVYAANVGSEVLLSVEGELELKCEKWLLFFSSFLLLFHAWNTGFLFVILRSRPSDMVEWSGSNRHFWQMYDSFSCHSIHHAHTSVSFQNQVNKDKLTKFAKETVWYFHWKNWEKENSHGTVLGSRTGTSLNKEIHYYHEMRLPKSLVALLI